MAVFPIAFNTIGDPFGTGRPETQNVRENMISMQAIPNNIRRYIVVSFLCERSKTTIIVIDPTQDNVALMIDEAIIAIICD